MPAIGSFDDMVTATGDEFVFVIPADALGDLDELLSSTAVPPTIAGRPITAVAPDPSVEDQVYVTTGDPESLAFLPDPYVELLR